MIDKSVTFLAAITAAGLTAWLCRFHGVRAFAREVQKIKGISCFLGPLMTLFKAVLKATTEVA
jgi:hypothetical protein